jgi:hypothetical protein
MIMEDDDKLNGADLKQTQTPRERVVHFVIGSYCNYKPNRLMRVNLTAPVRLQVLCAMMVVVMLHETFAVL